MNYVGNRWYKCDFHLHTLASSCYKLSDGENAENTYAMWVDKALKSGINCLAITDHNDYRSIDKIKSLCEEKGIIAFPGVEVTCDSSKIHLLVLFDRTESADSVKNFLIKIEAEADDHLGTDKSIKLVCEEAKKYNALIIAAHVDEFNGLCEMSDSTLIKFLNYNLIDAIQVVNSKIWDNYDSNNPDITYQEIDKKYGKTIPHDTVDNWRKTFFKLKKSNIPAIESSDNPFSEASSNHGLYGIGKNFTLLKMSEEPSLESVRQALLANDSRVRLTEMGKAYSFPEYWIRSLSVFDTTINPYAPINVDFNHQLNTIIGGRGSGKSSIIRILNGTLGASNPVTIKTIKEEQEKFYSFNDKEYGILNSKSKFELELVRNNEEYKIIINGFSKKNNTGEFSLSKKNTETGLYESIDDSNYLEFFRPQVYTQKQIFEIAKEPKALMNIIDQDIADDLSELNDNIRTSYQELLDCMRSKRELKRIINSESLLNTLYNDVTDQIKKYEQSGISSSLDKKNKYDEQYKRIEKYMYEADQVLAGIEQGISSLNIPSFDSSDYPSSIQSLLSQFENDTIEKKNQINNIINNIKSDFNNLTQTSHIKNNCAS